MKETDEIAPRRFEGGEREKERSDDDRKRGMSQTVGRWLSQAGLGSARPPSMASGGPKTVGEKRNERKKLNYFPVHDTT